MATVFPLVSECAATYGEIVQRRRRIGRSVPLMDCLVAAICLHERTVLATRNTREFEELGVELINPWDA